MARSKSKHKRIQHKNRLKAKKRAEKRKKARKVSQVKPPAVAVS
ncbi:MAG TPA: aminopeptidase [Nitrospinota bacterium]|nr:aminopeptidase [Nitrospinota bacterium]